jgi:hypothetical protein
MNYPLELTPTTLRQLEDLALREGLTAHQLILNLVQARIEQFTDESEITRLIVADAHSCPKVRGRINAGLTRAGLPTLDELPR